MTTAEKAIVRNPRAGLAETLARFREVGILVFLAAMVVVATAAEPRFLTLGNWENILLDISLLAIVACGETMVIISKNIDISVGSSLGLCAMVVGLLFKFHPQFPIFIGLLIGIALGMLLGAVNGTLITLFKVPPLITTLATLSVYRGLTFLVSGGWQVDPNDIPPDLISWAQTSPIRIPLLVIIAAVVAVAVTMFLRYARLGRDIYAVGNNPSAARLRGIEVSRVVFLVFIFAGGLAGLAGVLYASRYGTVNPADAGVGLELTVIAATVIGGTNILGGSGTILGSVLGSLLLGVLGNAMAVTNVSGFYQKFAQGLVILLAVIVDAIIHNQLQSRKQ
jgi:rhamnose transport system permease protein